MQKTSDSKKRETQARPGVKLVNRRWILEYLKFGICPECGYDTMRKFRSSHEPFDGAVMTSFSGTVMTYCTNTSCKFYEEAYRNFYKWLVHHVGI